MKHFLRNTILVGAVCMQTGVSGFAPIAQTRSTTSLRSEAATAESSADTIQTDPKEAVKLFGRLAEKYISESH